MRAGMRSNNALVYVTNSWSIQLPATTITRATPMSFGTKARVASWSCVTDWINDIPNPTARLTSKIGALTFAVTMSI